MKTVKLLIVYYLLFGVFNCFGQNTKCGYRVLDSMVLASDAGYSGRRVAYENAILDTMNEYKLDTLVARYADVDMANFRIPVVIHNIGVSSISQITAQNFINELNNRFSNANNGPGGVNTQIQFCLATLDPDGQATTGVTNPVNPNINGPFCISDDNTIKSMVSWNPSRYLNIWVCNLWGCLHPAWGSDPTQFLQNPATKFRDGVVCDMVIFNNNSLNIVPIVEEVGHWLSLLHTYGDGVSQCGTTGNSDLVNDTPWCYLSGGATFPSCSAPTEAVCATANGTQPVARLISNYMDDSSDDGCRNMFTLGQKTRMQLCLQGARSSINDIFSTLSKCGITNHCDNKVKDGDETGIDCGGATCPPCPVQPHCEPSVGFTLNGQLCYPWGKFINVCNNGGIILTAHDYSVGHEDCFGPEFSVKHVTRCTEHQEENPGNCWFRWTKQLWCCEYKILFISICECDQYKNLIGTEFGDWVNLPQGNNVPSFNLYTYLPLIGGSISDGSFYRIKVANGYQTYISYIKVYKSNLTLSNQTIVVDEIADYLTYNDCIVNTSRSMASTEIRITGESDLIAGDYAINTTYNCATLPTFRTASDNVPPPSTSVDVVQGDEFNGPPAVQKSFDAGIKKATLKVIPNPTEGNVRISLVNATMPASAIEITDISGLVLYSERNITQKDLDIDLKNLRPGVYLVRVNYKGLNYNTKLIKQ